MSGAERVILSARVGVRGSEAALIDASGRMLASARQRHPEPSPRWGFAAQDPRAIAACFEAVCGEMGAALEGAHLEAVVLCTERESALVVGSENRLQTPVLWGRGGVVPTSGVPARFREDPGLRAIYRRSPLRSVGLSAPEAVAGVRRYVSLGALLMNRMTGHWVDVSACPPTGAPTDRWRGEAETDAGPWLAFGVDRPAAPLLVPPGGVMAQLSPHFATRLGLRAWAPVIAAGDAAACALFTMESLETCWGVVLGSRLQAGWLEIEPEAAPGQGIKGDTVTFQVREDGELEPSPPTAGALARERLEGARAALGSRFEWHLGPEPGTATATVVAGGRPQLGDWLDLPWDEPRGEAQLLRAPLGAEGLRYIPGRDHGSWIGAREGHEARHRARAWFEGLGLELRRWRRIAGAEDALLRVHFGPGWSAELGAELASMLGAPVHVWDGASPALYGAAEIGWRVLGSPPFEALEGARYVALEPGPQSAAYTRHAGLHDHLAGLLDALG